jgi:hypothetical protein
VSAPAAGGTEWAARYQAICAQGAAGLLHEHATHHVAVDTSLGRIYGRDDWVAALVAERAGLTDGAAAGAQAWVGTSVPGRAVVVEMDWDAAHVADSPLFGAATGRRTVLASTLVGLVEGDRVYRAWRFVDHAAAARALDVDLDERARALVAGAPRRGGIPWEFGEVRGGLGQTAPPAETPPPPGLAPEHAAGCGSWLTAWNQRRFDLAAAMYRPGATILDGAEAIPVGSPRHPWALAVAACPHAVLFVEHAVTGEIGPGEARVALVWRWVGAHTGVGLGPPCNHRLHLRGASVLHLRQGRIARERVVFDQLGARRDALLRAMSDEPRP